MTVIDQQSQVKYWPSKKDTGLRPCSKVAVRLCHLCGLIDILTEWVNRVTAEVQGVVLQHLHLWAARETGQSNVDSILWYQAIKILDYDPSGACSVAKTPIKMCNCLKRVWVEMLKVLEPSPPASRLTFYLNLGEQRIFSWVTKSNWFMHII